jgi:hypothetical protein
LTVKLVEQLTLPPLVAQLIQVLGELAKKRPLAGFRLRRGRLAKWPRRPRMHADYHLNWGWRKATARLYGSDEIFCLFAMGYKKLLSGAE